MSAIVFVALSTRYRAIREQKLIKPAARMFEDDHKREAGGTEAGATSVARYTGRP